MKKTSITIMACVLLSVASREARCAGRRAARPLQHLQERQRVLAGVFSRRQNRNAGRPGARVRVELDRDGRARFVSTRTVFHAGDKVRFHFAMNFPGYVVVINQGSSGKRSLLFPYKGVSNHIGRTADYTVPQGEGWFEFDDTPGTEQLTFIMSKREIRRSRRSRRARMRSPAAAAPSSGQPSHPPAPHPRLRKPRRLPLRPHRHLPRLRHRRKSRRSLPRSTRDRSAEDAT